MTSQLMQKKAYDKFQYPFMEKAFNKVDKEGTYLNVIKPIYDKPTANIIFNVEKLKQDNNVHYCHFYSTHY